eukprot:10974538-Alexandrium_andersonii.AAC.2
MVLDLAWVEMLWRHGSLLGERYRPVGLRTWPPHLEDTAPAAPDLPGPADAGAATANAVASPAPAVGGSSFSTAALAPDRPLPPPGVAPP